MSLVAIALDRYLAVLNKSQAKILQSKTFCFAGLFSIWAFSCAISSPTLFSYEMVVTYIVPDEDPETFYMGVMCMTDMVRKVRYFELTVLLELLICLVRMTWQSSTTLFSSSFSCQSCSLSFGSTQSSQMRYGSDVMHPALSVHQSANEGKWTQQRWRLRTQTIRTQALTFAITPAKSLRANLKILLFHQNSQFSLFNRQRRRRSRTLRLAGIINDVNAKSEWLQSFSFSCQCFWFVACQIGFFSSTSSAITFQDVSTGSCCTVSVLRDCLIACLIPCFTRSLGKRFALHRTLAGAAINSASFAGARKKPTNMQTTRRCLPTVSHGIAMGVFTWDHNADDDFLDK